MNNIEIEWLMQLEPTFVGVFPSDALPTPVRLDSCFIVNTDSANLAGHHWLAVRINKQGRAHYFDPLGYHPIARICNHLLRYVNEVYYTVETTQNPTTNFCGHFCIQFLYCYCIITDPLEFINKLTVLLMQ